MQEAQENESGSTIKCVFQLGNPAHLGDLHLHFLLWRAVSVPDNGKHAAQLLIVPVPYIQRAQSASQSQILLAMNMIQPASLIWT